MIQEGKKYSAILLLILGLFLLYPVARTVYHINRWNTDGTGGYNSSYWKANKIVTYLLKAPATSATVYTNNIYPLKYFLNFKAGKNIHILTQDQKSEVSGRILVCFEKHWTYPEEECLTEHLKNKTMLIKNQDGTIWQLNQQ